MKKVIALSIVLFAAQIVFAQFQVTFGTIYQVPPLNSDPSKFQVNITLTNTSGIDQPSYLVEIKGDASYTSGAANSFVFIESVQQSPTSPYVFIGSLPTQDAHFDGQSNVIPAGSSVVFTVTVTRRPDAVLPPSEQAFDLSFAVLKNESSSLASANVAIPASATPLPVSFGNIAATYKSGNLRVNWQTLKETNNKLFEVQGSTDGKIFTTIGTVDTEAVGGNSDVTLSYSFSKSIADATQSLGFGGVAIALALISLALYGFTMKRKLLISGLAMIVVSIVFAACTKSDAAVNTEAMPNMWIRIAQKDIDNTVHYSKVVRVIEE